MKLYENIYACSAFVTLATYTLCIGSAYNNKEYLYILYFVSAGLFLMIYTSIKDNPDKLIYDSQVPLISFAFITSSIDAYCFVVFDVIFIWHLLSNIIYCIAFDFYIQKNNDAILERLANKYIHSVIMSIAHNGKYSIDSTHFELLKSTPWFNKASEYLYEYGSWNPYHISTHEYIPNEKGKKLVRDVEQEMLIRHTEREIWQLRGL